MNRQAFAPGGWMNCGLLLLAFSLQAFVLATLRLALWRLLVAFGLAR